MMLNPALPVVAAQLAMLKQGFKMFATERSGRERMDVKRLGEAMRSFGANPLNAQLDMYMEEFEDMEKGELVRHAAQLSCPPVPNIAAPRPPPAIPPGGGPDRDKPTRKLSHGPNRCPNPSRASAATGLSGLPHQDGTAEEGRDEERRGRLRARPGVAGVQQVQYWLRRSVGDQGVLRANQLDRH
eukprot:SAG31_NODE_3214_length_4535_cov_2.601306_2_plen_185_part_00